MAVSETVKHEGKASPKPLKIFLIAGEASGDMLGSKLMDALSAAYDDVCQFYGVGGELMQERGVQSLFPMQELSIMGFAEIIPHIPHLLGRIKQTAEAIEEIMPDVVITIDAPEFNFRVAKKIQHLRAKGVKSMHYVAPSVWAYRPKRAEHISKLYDHLLALLPFEPPYFTKEGLDCTFVGHPIVEDAYLGNGERFRKQYHIARDNPVLCMMPGSRHSEFNRLWPVFSGAVGLLSQRESGMAVVIPTVPALANEVRERIAHLPVRAIVVEDVQDKKDAYAASNVALVKSGTGTFELAMSSVPMIVAYKVSPFSAWLARKLLQIEHVNLINLIAEKEVIPEYLQEDCTPIALADALETLLHQKEQGSQQREASYHALKTLGLGQKKTSSEKAADAVLSVVGLAKE